MHFKTLASLGTVVSTPFGLAFLLAPAATAAQYDIALPDAPTQALARCFGSALLAQAALLWGVHGLQEPSAQRRIAGWFAAATTIGFGLAVQTQVSGAVGSLGWISVLIYGGFAIGWGLAWRPPAAGLARA
jgi:hypothetical protein